IGNNIGQTWLREEVATVTSRSPTPPKKAIAVTTARPTEAGPPAAPIPRTSLRAPCSRPRPAYPSSNAGRPHAAQGAPGQTLKKATERNESSHPLHGEREHKLAQRSCVS